MHQHPRSAPVTASPANSPRTNPARTNNSRDRDPESTLLQADVGVNNVRGLGIEEGNGALEQGQTNTVPAKEVVAKLNQIIQNYHTKAALIILHSRVDLPAVRSRGSDVKRVNRWFNVELDETDVLREDLRTWKYCDTSEHRPPPLIIETFLDANELTHSQTLVIIDDHGKRWDVLEALAASRSNSSRGSPGMNGHRIVLERWKIELGEPSSKLPADLGAILPTVYKKSIVLFRSLFTYSKFLPAWKFSKRQSKVRSSPALRIRYRIFEGSRDKQASLADSLTIPLYEGNSKAVETYAFGVTESPAGPFSVQVTYRTNCEFRVDDSEALLSSRFMGADDNFFRPSLPSEETVRAIGPEAGSLPLGGQGVGRPDRSQAYGSMSTYHQVGPTTGASPISTLRAARELGATSPGSPTNQPPSPKVGQAARVAIRSGEGAFAVQRRPSVSFQPFKAPVLSASPYLGDLPVGSSPRNATPVRAANIANDGKNMPPSVPFSTSGSPKPAPISKYSSSFSHRRGRLSSGGTSKTDDDNNSSGKASATSSAAQPSSGIIAEGGGTGSNSMHADEDNISEFIKMLELKKDLLTPADSTALDATTRRTSAALTRFQRMKDSNTALSDSMSSSLILQRSSTSSSRQLPNVPPMIAGTSTSASSSPGKPISPHTPHTPAIPSRLSSNSIIDYSRQDGGNGGRHNLSTESHGSLLEETTSDETAREATASNVNAIDIPTSPLPFISSYRRSSSAAQRRTSAALEDELGDFLPFGMRSISLGAEERSPLSLSALLRQQEFDGNILPADVQRTDQPSALVNDDTGAPEGAARGPDCASGNSSHHTYQPRFGHHRGRSSTGLPQSHSSASSSLGRGNALSIQGGDRERDRELCNGSGSNSGISNSTDSRRGGGVTSNGRRSSFNRHHASPPNTFEDEEPLLFVMSDFGVSRRSLEEGGRGNLGGGDTAGGGGNGGGSRRWSGRRAGVGGGTSAGFQAWQ